MKDDLTAFLAARLEGGSEWIGVSSNAMVREALDGDPVQYDWEYPHDHADLARCCMTWARAPWSLKAIMLPRLTAYCEYAMNGYRKPESVVPEPVVPEMNPLERWLGRLGWRIGFRIGAGEKPPAWLKSPYDKVKDE